MPRFRLLAGQHIENDQQGRERRYTQGSVFDSTSDLTTLNRPGYSPKFERVYEAPMVVSEGTLTSQPYDPHSHSQSLAATQAAQTQAQSQTAQTQTPKGDNVKVSRAPVPTTPPRKSPAPPPSNQAPPNDGLDAMSMDDLRKLASEEEIDIGALIKKDDIVKVIRMAMGP